MPNSTKTYVQITGAAVLVLGCVIWLFNGVPYSMLWLWALMLIGGMLLLRVAQKSQDRTIDEQGDTFLK